MERVTIKDIAAKAGVSVTTVSLVLNGKEHRIAQETRKKIIDIANALEYRPNQLAVGLITKRTNTNGSSCIYRKRVKCNVAIRIDTAGSDCIGSR